MRQKHWRRIVRKSRPPHCPSSRPCQRDPWCCHFVSKPTASPPSWSFPFPKRPTEGGGNPVQRPANPCDKRRAIAETIRAARYEPPGNSRCDQSIWDRKHGMRGKRSAWPKNTSNHHDITNIQVTVIQNTSIVNIKSSIPVHTGIEIRSKKGSKKEKPNSETPQKQTR